MALSSQPVSAFLPNKEKLYSEEVSSKDIKKKDTTVVDIKQPPKKSSSSKKKSSSKRDEPQQTIDTETLPSNARVVEVDGKQYVNIVTRKNEVKATYSADKWNKQVGYEVQFSNGGGYSTSIKPSPSQRSYIEIGQEVAQKKQLATSIRQNSRQSSYVDPSVSENVFNRPTSYFQSIDEYNPTPVATGQDKRTILSGGSQFYTEDFTARRPLASSAPVSYSDRTAIEIQQPVAQKEKSMFRTVYEYKKEREIPFGNSTLKMSTPSIKDTVDRTLMVGTFAKNVGIAIKDEAVGISNQGFYATELMAQGYWKEGFGQLVQTVGKSNIFLGSFVAPEEGLVQTVKFGKKTFMKLFTESVPLARITEQEVIAGIKQSPTSSSIVESVTKFTKAKEELIKVGSYKRTQSTKLFSDNPNLASNTFIVDTPQTIEKSTRGGQYVAITGSPSKLSGTTAGKGFKAQVGAEDAGIYVSSGFTKKVRGRASIGFTGLTDGGYSKPKLTLNPFSPLLEAWNTPTLTTLRYKNYIRLPRNVANEAGFGGVSRFQKKSLLGTSTVTLTKRSEIALGGVKRQWYKAPTTYVDPWNKKQIVKGQLVKEHATEELESVLYEGARFRYNKSKAKGLKGYFRNKFGFSQYTEIGGEIVGLPKATVLERKALKQELEKEIAQFRNSKDYKRFSKGSKAYSDLSTGRKSSFSPKYYSSFSGSSQMSSPLKSMSSSSSIISNSSSSSILPKASSSSLFGRITSSSLITSKSSSGLSIKRVSSGSSFSPVGGSSSSSIFGTVKSTSPVGKFKFTRKSENEFRKRQTKSTMLPTISIKKYTPTAYASAFNIKGKKIVGKLSGLEFRGVA